MNHMIHGALFAETLVCQGRGERKKAQREKEREPRNKMHSLGGKTKEPKREGGKKLEKRKLTQPRIIAKSIKFDQVCYNEVRLHIPSRDNEDRSQAVDLWHSLCAWNMQ